MTMMGWHGMVMGRMEGDMHLSFAGNHYSVDVYWCELGVRFLHVMVINACGDGLCVLQENHESEFDKLFDLSSKVSATIRKALEQRRESVSQQISKTVPVDGGYDTLTVQVR